MVVFTCEACNESLKKNKVEAHLFKCRRSRYVTCIDCQLDFDRESYKAHTSCITEMEKYSAPGYVPKASANKGAKKQDDWFQRVQSAIDGCAASGGGQQQQQQLSRVLYKVRESSNVPRKQAKFVNFCRNSMKWASPAVIQQAWSLLAEGAQQQQQQPTPQPPPPPPPTGPDGDGEGATKELRPKKRPAEAAAAADADDSGSVGGDEAPKKKKKKKKDKKKKQSDDDGAEAELVAAGAEPELQAAEVQLEEEAVDQLEAGLEQSKNKKKKKKKDKKARSDETTSQEVEPVSENTGNGTEPDGHAEDPEPVLPDDSDCGQSKKNKKKKKKKQRMEESQEEQSAGESREDEAVTDAVPEDANCGQSEKKKKKKKRKQQQEENGHLVVEDIVPVLS